MSAADALTWVPDCPLWCESSDCHQGDLSAELKNAMDVARLHRAEPATMDRIIEGTEVGVIHALTFGEGSRWSVRLEAMHLYGEACGEPEAEVFTGRDGDALTVEEVEGIALATQRLAETMRQMAGQPA